MEEIKQRDKMKPVVKGRAKIKKKGEMQKLRWINVNKVDKKERKKN